jgi:hypothetical protein
MRSSLLDAVRPLQAILAHAAAGASPAGADSFEIGEVEATANVELSYGFLARVEDRDEDLVAIANGGKAASANWDDGDLNYDEGIASNAVQANVELSARWRSFGAYARGIAFYDFETELSGGSLPIWTATPTSTSARTSRFANTTSTRLPRARSRPYLAGGTGAQLGRAPSSASASNGDALDIAAACASERPRDLEIPQGMLWGRRTSPRRWPSRPSTSTTGSPCARSREAGTSPTTTCSASTVSTARWWARASSPTRGRTSTPRSSSPPARSASTPTSCGSRATAATSRAARGRAVTLQLILPYLNSTKLAFHFLNYHSRLPIVNARSADAAAAAATSPAAVAARAAALAPVYESEGLPPTAAAAAAAQAASTLTIGDYASAASFAIEYPEDIQMVGVSFNTATLRTGTLVSGEVSHHFDYPFQILPLDVFSAAFSPIEFDPSFGQGPLGDFGPDEEVSGVERLDKTQLELGLRQLLGPRLGASQAILGADFGYVYVHDLPRRDELRLNAPGVTGAADFDHLPDASSWGYRVIGALTYDNVLGGVSVQPYAAWLHDVKGVTPTPGGAFVEGRRAFNVGVSIDYTNTWLLDVSYTNLSGAGRFNLLNDRDFVRLQLTYFY